MKHTAWNTDEVRGGAGEADGDWDDFIKDKAAYWDRHRETDCPCTITMLEFLGMTPDEYADWFMTGRVASRVKRAWSPRGMRSLYP